MTQHVDTILNIGKNGLTQGVIDELKLHLKKKKTIKVKMLRSFLGEANKKEKAQEVASACNAEVVNITGLTVLLNRKHLKTLFINNLL